MDADDPRRTLLDPVPNGQFRRVASKLCGLNTWKKRIPITAWLPAYSLEYLVRDAIAGITVGLTSIPQGIAYAVVAGLPPQVGLYSSIFPGLVYVIFGSCYMVTIGPTAILAALLAKYVAISPDFAYLAAFLSGCLMLLLGLLQLGFLLDFISKPVISGFTTAAALQIGAAQLKSLFRVKESSGDTFIETMINFFKNIKTVHLWDSVLGVASIVILIILKRLSARPPLPPRAPRPPARCPRPRQHAGRARNALVVFGGAALAYALYVHGKEPFALTGNIEGGLPRFGPPPFSTHDTNGTALNFGRMLATFGAEGLVMPLVAILETIAIAKAFSGTSSVDATQEMIAIGACNIVSSFAQAMPTTGSFTRTALNYDSGVATPAGSVFKASLVLLSVTLLAQTFYFIPRATLAAVIIVAMCSLIELGIVKLLWRNSKMELLVYVVTVSVGVAAGLEYGIVSGAACDAARALAATARPTLHTALYKVGNVQCVSVTLPCVLSYGSAQHACDVVRRAAGGAALLVLDGRTLTAVDVGVAETVTSVIKTLEKQNHICLLWNFPEKCRRLFHELHPGCQFVTGPSIDQHILVLDIDRRDVGNPTTQYQ